MCVCVCQCVIQAVSSIQSSYQQRAAKAEDWRASQLLSLLSDSSKIMMVAHTDAVCVHMLCLFVSIVTFNTVARLLISTDCERVHHITRCVISYCLCCVTFDLT